MVFCEIVYDIYQKNFVINNLKNMHLSIILASSRILRFIYIYVALVDDKENLLT